MKDQTVAFPKNFIWGTATASYQIEGAVAEDGRGQSIWDTFSHAPEKIKNNENGDIACDHYHRLDEDLNLFAKLVPNYRFSIAWPRILPNGTGQINQKGVDFYNRLIDGLLERDVTPWITMYHWDLPQILQDNGGWTNRDILGCFEEYANVLIKNFGDRVKEWIILNEPSTHAYLGHGAGVHAPGLNGLSSYCAATHHMNLVVGRTAHQLKKTAKSFHVGSAYVLMPIRAMEGQGDATSIEIMDALWNRNHYDPLFKGEYPKVMQKDFEPFIKVNDDRDLIADLDYVGVQHYSPAYARNDINGLKGVSFGQGPEEVEKTDIGWPIDPPAFFDALMDQKERYKPHDMIVTENGIALFDKPSNGHINDQKRIRYMHDYLSQLNRAIDNGVSIKGYFAWTTMDNFEWAAGFETRFGLIYVDLIHCSELQKRHSTGFADVARQNAFPSEIKTAA